MKTALLSYFGSTDTDEETRDAIIMLSSPMSERSII